MSTLQRDSRLQLEIPESPRRGIPFGDTHGTGRGTERQGRTRPQVPIAPEDVVRAVRRYLHQHVWTLRVRLQMWRVTTAVRWQRAERERLEWLLRVSPDESHD